MFKTIGQRFKFHVGQIEHGVANGLTLFSSFQQRFFERSCVLRCNDAEMGPANLLLAPAYNQLILFDLMEQDESVTLDVSRPLFWVHFFDLFTTMKKERQKRTENNWFDSQSVKLQKLIFTARGADLCWALGGIICIFTQFCPIFNIGGVEPWPRFCSGEQIKWRPKKRSSPKIEHFFPQIQVNTKKKVFNKTETFFFYRIQVDTYAQMHTRVELLRGGGGGGGCRCRPYSSYWGRYSQIVGGYISPPGFGTPVHSFPAWHSEIKSDSAYPVCGRHKDRWLLDSTTERFLCCLLAKTTR